MRSKTRFDKNACENITCFLLEISSPEDKVQGAKKKKNEVIFF